MESKLTKYLEKDIKKIIQSVKPIACTAKTGQPYVAIEMKFNNGYSKRLFLKSEEEFAWINAIELLDAEKTIEAEF